MPPGGGFIPHSGGGLSPQMSGFILAKGWFYPPKGMVLCPHWLRGGGSNPLWVLLSPPFGDFIPPLGGGGGGAGLSPF